MLPDPWTEKDDAKEVAFCMEVHPDIVEGMRGLLLKGVRSELIRAAVRQVSKLQRTRKALRLYLAIRTLLRRAEIMILWHAQPEAGDN